MVIEIKKFSLLGIFKKFLIKIRVTFFLKALSSESFLIFYQFSTKNFLTISACVISHHMFLIKKSILKPLKRGNIWVFFPTLNQPITELH